MLVLFIFAIAFGSATVGFSLAAMFSVDAYEKGFEDGRRSK